MYLGTLTDADSVHILERIATECPETDLVRVAVANLVLNQSTRSSVGMDMVVRELTNSPTKVGIDLAIKLAAASPDPRLREAGASFDTRREGEKIWKQQGLARVDWSIWSWADDYLLHQNSTGQP
jgi:hypothetical protein